MNESSAIPLTLSVETLKGVGPRVAARLARLEIHTVEDLLLHLPLRYQDRTRISPLGELAPGVEAVVEGDVANTKVVRRARSSLLCRIQDGTGFLTLRFFHFTAAQQAMLAPGTRLRCYGEVRRGASSLEMIHPECRRLDQDSPAPVETHLTPVYPTTEGLHQITLRSLAEQALRYMDEAGDRGPLLREWLPQTLLERFDLPPIGEAVRLLHRPPSDAPLEQLESDRHPARRRLVFEELLAHQLSLRRLRERIRRHPAPVLPRESALVAAFIKGLPFALTQAQERVIAEIAADLDASRPMLRLVQGDVGSGKTVVAAASALQAVAAGYQAVVMAPTELLAEQHFINFRTWLAPLGIEIDWLSGRLKGKAREAARGRIRSGEAQVITGTHALFQDNVAFADLALVIIDEQHRFGVHQRLALRDKGRQDQRRPHQLVMTATPIPRTLAMSAYADLDTSVIDELPSGRTPVRTAAVSENRRKEVIERIRQACRQGRQAYWVCTLIEESELMDSRAAEDTFALLAQALPELRIGLAHGRLKPEQKEQVMAAFKAGDLDLLVATTVIEVGVDVANASLMIIENAERLGLAQLHQLRGRVGRGSIQSSCLMLYRPPLSAQARARLEALRESNDGFEIARRDLEMRGPGEVLGLRQTGALQFKVADLTREGELLPAVRRAADELLRDYPANAEAVIGRWIGQGERYGEV